MSRYLDVGKICIVSLVLDVAFSDVLQCSLVGTTVPLDSLWLYNQMLTRPTKVIMGKRSYTTLQLTAHMRASFHYVSLKLFVSAVVILDGTESLVL